MNINFLKRRMAALQQYISFKNNSEADEGSVVFNLTNLSYVGGSTATAGSPYTTTLQPVAGYYLPLTISVTGTNSAYGFEYDYTTGVIYIPADEVIGKITITAEACAIETNIPAVLNVQKVSADTSDGTNTYTGESFILLDIYPSRGSTVSVTFDGVTKTVTGDLATEQYDSTSKQVFFGTYLGQSDGTTATSGELIIEGAYESFFWGTYTSASGKSNNSTLCSCIVTIGENSCRYLIARKYLTAEETLVQVMISPFIANILDDAFKYCSSLTSVTIPDSVTSIGDYAFYKCSSLASVAIPDSVTSIGDYAFAYCSGLTSVVIGDSVTSIGQQAFYNTAHYNNSINWENGVLYIGNYLIKANEDISGDYTIKDSTLCIADYAFESNGLTSITVDENNKNYKSIDGNLYSYDGTILIQYALGKTDSSFEIPNSVTLIGNGAFYHCNSLTSVVIPDSVTSIGNKAFYYCDSLTSVVIGDSVTIIGNWAFRNCTNLTSVGIPDSVTLIGSYAFAYGSILTSVVIGDSVTSIGDSAFYDCISLKTIRFKGTTAQWNAITFGLNWDTSISATYVQCSDGQVTL